MEDSILKTTKKILNIPDGYSAFDMDVILYINTAFGILEQLGVGPAGFSIEDETKNWSDFSTSEEGVNMIRSYVFLRVKLLFDPPTTSYMIEATKNQVEMLEWRISTHREWLLDPHDPRAA